MMNVEEIISALKLESLASTDQGLKQEVTGGYASDLLSIVMANAGEGNVWVTMQGHQNIIAVAVLLGLSSIIVAGGVAVDQDTLEKAEEEGIPLLASEQPVFEVVGQLYQAGVRGTAGD